MFDTPDDRTVPWDAQQDDALETAVLAATEEAWSELMCADAGTRPCIPAQLDQIPPGPTLAAVLSAIDVDSVDGYDRVVVLRAHARLAAHYQAHVYADMASVTVFMRNVEDDVNVGAHAAAAEIRLALNLTRRATETELAMALDLTERLPSVWDAFAAGEIDMRRARCIAHCTAHVPMAQARLIADEVLLDAAEMTTGEIAARLRRMCLTSEPDDAAQRYEDAVASRRITVEQNPDGTGNLFACDLPADRLTAIQRRLHDVAMSLRTKHESRTMDQLRTDIFLDLLDGVPHAQRQRRGVVDIHVDLTTLAGLTNAPGELNGFGPVVADVARRIVAESGDSDWRWTVVDQRRGVVANGTTRRRPTTTQRRRIEARFRTCVFPGCRMPATRSDLDHTIPHAEGGATTEANLAPLCRHDHTIRHLPGWSYRTQPDGTVRWRTGLGHAYTSGRPPP